MPAAVATGGAATAVVAPHSLPPKDQPMSKFGALSANVAETFKVELIDPGTDLPIVDKQGNTAFVEVLSGDSEVGREFDKQRRKQQMMRAMRGRNQMLAQEDPLDENQAKLARLTRSWHLVEPGTGELVDLPCNEQTALELYSDGGAQWLYRQVFLGANEVANFIKRPLKNSSPMPSGTSS
jgi:hypothetical protein